MKSVLEVHASNQREPAQSAVHSVRCGSKGSGSEGRVQFLQGVKERTGVPGRRDT